MNTLNAMIVVNCVLGCLNLLILIGLAGTVAKILQYLAGKEIEEVMPSRDEKLLDLQTGQLYRDDWGQLADPEVLAGGEPHYDGVSNRNVSNWDGMPVEKS